MVTRRWSYLGAFGAVAVSGLVPLVAGCTWVVPTGGSIQAAIDAAAPGDVVLVEPGRYVEHLDFKGKAIEVRASGGPQRTILDGGGAQRPVVSFVHREGRSSVLRGFTITGGVSGGDPHRAGGGGIVVVSAAPTIVENHIVDNRGCTDGIGVYVHFAAPRLERNTIARNGRDDCAGAPLHGAGMFVGGAAVPEVVGAHHTELVGNTIADNGPVSGSADGAGVRFHAPGRVVFANNVVTENRGHSAVTLVNASPVRFSQNVIVRNSGRGLTIATTHDGPAPEIRQTTIAANGDAALRVETRGPVAVRNTILHANGGPALTCAEGTAVTFDHDLAWSVGSHAVDGCPFTVGGQGNQLVPPRFVDNRPYQPGVSGGDFRLQAGSPAVDRGTPLDGLPPEDIDGRPRIVDGDGDGRPIVDLGAYERSG